MDKLLNHLAVLSMADPASVHRRGWEVDRVSSYLAMADSASVGHGRHLSSRRETEDSRWVRAVFFEQ